MVEPSDAGAEVLPPLPTRVAFVGRRGLFWLLLRNLLLNIVSLSFYRFWARTAVRRFYWSSVVFAGEPLEFTGRGLDLFIGFLIALAILAPLGFAFSTIAQMLEPGGMAQAITGWAYLFALFALTLIARYRARRYRLSRTSWRGIRFAVDGSTLRYVLLSTGWWLAVLATLGIATPWKRAAQRAYLTRTTTFGDRRFAFSGRPSALLLNWLFVLALVLGPIALVVWVNFNFIPLLVIQIMSAPRMQTGFVPLQGLGLLLVVPTLGLAAYVFYRVAELRMFTAATSLGEIRFRSTMVAWGVFFLLLLVAIAAAVTGFGILTAAPSMIRGLVASGWPLSLVLYGVVFGGFAIWAGILYFLINGWLRRTIIATYFESVTVENAALLDEIGQTAQRAPTRGEGLADSFEFGAS